MCSVSNEAITDRSSTKNKAKLIMDYSYFMYTCSLHNTLYSVPSTIAVLVFSAN